MRDTRKHQEGTKLRKGGLLATEIVTTHCEGAGHEVLHREAVGGGKKKTVLSQDAAGGAADQSQMSKIC